MSHLKRAVGGHLLKNAAGHLVHGCGCPCAGPQLDAYVFDDTIFCRVAGSYGWLTQYKTGDVCVQEWVLPAEVYGERRLLRLVWDTVTETCKQVTVLYEYSAFEFREWWQSVLYPVFPTDVVCDEESGFMWSPHASLPLHSVGAEGSIPCNYYGWEYASVTFFKT